jgi:putative protease
MKYSDVEIMAPAGSFEALSAAIHAGCHSVYFGVEQLNMRARSSINFTTDDLVKIYRQCADHNVKTYLTLNTILYDHDIRLMKTIIDCAKESGVTAVIAADHAAMAYCKEVGMPVHLSTQANVSNVETVQFYAGYADVIVLARELSLSQVANIITEIKRKDIKGPAGELIKIEVFAHGALCMAISGKCYLSLHSHNASANRGACIQNCRKEYVVTSKEDGIELEIDNEYIMSAKDLCTIGFLDKVLDAGVSVLKIEGRGRSADYVDTVVGCYRQALDALQDGSYGPEKIAQWTTELSKVYNRGFWDGYYLGRTMGEWSDAYGSKATEKKIHVGQCIKYYPKIKVGEFQMASHSLRKGDQILITGPTTGVTRSQISDMRVGEHDVENVEKGDIFTLPVPEAVRPKDKIYKVVTA